MIALTVDNTTGRNSETYLRTRPKDLHQCLTAMRLLKVRRVKERPMYDGIDMTGVRTQNPADGLGFRRPPAQIRGRENSSSRASTRAKTRAFASITALTASWFPITADAPRKPCAPPSRRCRKWWPKSAATSRCLSMAAFRRGTDVFKALALGAKAVGIGRPFLWGLGAFGQAWRRSRDSKSCRAN